VDNSKGFDSNADYFSTSKTTIPFTSLDLTQEDYKLNSYYKLPKELDTNEYPTEGRKYLINPIEVYNLTSFTKAEDYIWYTNDNQKLDYKPRSITKDNYRQKKIFL